MTDPTPRRIRFPVVLGFAVLIVLAVLAMAAVRSWHDLAAQRAREAAVEGSIAHTEAEVRGLEERIRRLKEDPFTLERLARRELGLVRAEDLVMVFPEGPVAVGLPASPVEPAGSLPPAAAAPTGEPEGPAEATAPDAPATFQAPAVTPVAGRPAA